MNHSLEELLKEQIRDLFDAEHQYQRLLPRMIENCTAADLKSFMAETLEETAQNIYDIERICETFGIAAEGVTCDAMEGLIRESRRSAKENVDSATLDAAIIANAQRIAHYEIAGFGTGSAFAKCIKADDVAALLSKMAASAGERDKRLSKIATGNWFRPGINDEAAADAPKLFAEQQTQQ